MSDISEEILSKRNDLYVNMIAAGSFCENIMSLDETQKKSLRACLSIFSVSIMEIEDTITSFYLMKTAAWFIYLILKDESILLDEIYETIRQNLIKKFEPYF